MRKFTNDHRTRVTKLLIRQAFMQLLEKKSIENITVKELCENAGINRGTFYTHYQDIYDLRAKIEEDLMDQFEEMLKPLFAEENSVTPLAVTTEIFQFLKNNTDICVVILADYGNNALATKVIQMMGERCRVSYSHYFKNASMDKIEYFYAFISTGCIGLLQKWIADGMRLPIEEVARHAERMMMVGAGFLES